MQSSFTRCHNCDCRVDGQGQEVVLVAGFSVSVKQLQRLLKMTLEFGLSECWCLKFHRLNICVNSVVCKIRSNLCMSTLRFFLIYQLMFYDIAGLRVYRPEYFLNFICICSHGYKLFLSASLYFSKRGAYWDRLCRDVVGRWLSRACTVAKRCILGL